MTRRDHTRAMDRIYSRAPQGDEYPIEFAPVGPEDRGQIGRVRIRAQSGAQNGASPMLRDLWWLRCPWCREMIELPRERLHLDAGLVRIDGTIVCQHCETAYGVVAGLAVRVQDVEGAGRVDVTSEPTGTSRKDL